MRKLLVIALVFLYLAAGGFARAQQGSAQWGQDKTGASRNVYVLNPGTGVWVPIGSFNATTNAWVLPVGMSVPAAQVAVASATDADVLCSQSGAPVDCRNLSGAAAASLINGISINGAVGNRGALFDVERQTLSPVGVVFTQFNYTLGLGNNTNFYGVGAQFINVSDAPGVTGATKGVLYGIDIDVTPGISRNNSPADDADGLVVQNNASGAFKATDLIYIGHNGIFSAGAAEAVASFNTQANTDVAYRATGTYVWGFDLCNSDNSCAVIIDDAIRIPNGSVINSTNGAGTGEVTIAQVDASNNLDLGASAASIKPFANIAMGGHNVTGFGLMTSTLNANGSLLTFGTPGGSIVSSSTPDAIDMGNDVSGTAGQFPKLALFDGVGVVYGIGVSVGSLDYMVSSGAGHAFWVNGVNEVKITSASLTVSPTTASTSPATGAFVDVGGLGVGGAGYFGGFVRPGGFTVAALPAGSAGARAYVTDATSCTFLGSLTGGGSTYCPVTYNGSAWVGGG